MNLQATARSSLLRFLLPLALLLGAIFLTVGQARTLLERALQSAFAPHVHSFRSVWFDWRGNVVAKELVLQPQAGGELRFGRVWLATPGWGFFLRNALDRDLARAPFPHLHLVLTEATETGGLAALVPEFGPVGASSGAVLEAAGCERTTAFDRERLGELGLALGDTRLEASHQLEGERLATSFTLETQGSSLTRLDRSGPLAAPAASLLGARPAMQADTERWHVRDQGFVPARNRACAEEDGVAPRDFDERHLAALDALLAQAGLAVDDNARAFYRRFARSGGAMSFGGAYQPPLAADDATRDGGRALARMNATLERDTRAVPVVWRLVTPTAPRVDPAPEVAVPPATEAAGTAPVDSPAVEPRPIEPTPPAAPPETPPTPAPSTAPPSPVKPRGDAPRIERAPPATRRATLDWDDLPRHRGRLIRLWTVHNPPRTVELLDAGPGELRVRARLGGGAAEYTVQRDGFLRATLLE